MRRWVSLGGWCGPTQMLAKLGMQHFFNANATHISFPFVPLGESEGGSSLRHDATIKLPLHHREPVHYPFALSRCTLDGIIDLTRNGFGESADQLYLERFLPERKRRGDGGSAEGGEVSHYYDMDFVHIWCLFRSKHCCFTHFDLHSDVVLANIQKWVAAWEHLFLLPEHDPRALVLLDGGDGVFAPRGAGRNGALGGINFVRTVIAENPLEELELLPALHDAFREKVRTQNRLGEGQEAAGLDFRTIVIVHDQAPRTMPLCTIDASAAGARGSHPCIVWNLQREGGGGAEASGQAASLFDQCHNGYQTIFNEMTKETRWKTLAESLPSLPQFVRQRRGEHGAAVFTPYKELSLIDGRVPAMRGSCKGVYSTLYEEDSARPGCAYCGNTEGHPAALYLPAAAQSGDIVPWEEDDVGALLEQYVNAGGDEVATTEAVAIQLHKSAQEVYGQLQKVLGK